MFNWIECFLIVHISNTKIQLIISFAYSVDLKRGRTIRLSGGGAGKMGRVKFFFFFKFFLGSSFFFFFFFTSWVKFFFFFFFLTVRRLWRHFWCKTCRGLRGWAPEKQAIYRHSGPYWRDPGAKRWKILLFYAIFCLISMRSE